MNIITTVGPFKIRYSFFFLTVVLYAHSLAYRGEWGKSAHGVSWQIGESTVYDVLYDVIIIHFDATHFKMAGVKRIRRNSFFLCFKQQICVFVLKCFF